jgi:FdhE protein
MTDRLQPRPGRPDSAEVSELRAIAVAQPALADAVQMQIELIEFARRIQTRVATLPGRRPAASIADRLQRGQRLLEVDDVPFDWPDLRLSLRQVSDILMRYGTVEIADHQALVGLAREGDSLVAVVGAWYGESAAAPADRAPSPLRSGYPAVLDEVLTLAARPFLIRAVEMAARNLPETGWPHAWCLFCGALPDLAVIQANGERHLICSRCFARWAWDPLACLWCNAHGTGAVRTFASPDRRYRVYGCTKCRRYLKAYDMRGARRPVMPLVDAIATLPLDAAAVQQGFGE